MRESKMILEIAENIKKELSATMIDISTTDHEIIAGIRPDHVKMACSYVYKVIGCSLSALFANDERSMTGSFAVYYIFSVKNTNTVITLKVPVPENNTGLDSVSIEIPAAVLPEREICDMFGIVFKNIPDERELVFHGNWPKGQHPLRKGFGRSVKLPFAEREQKFLRIEGTGVFEIPVGPVHAGIIEPGHFRFSVAGEPIINLEAKLYYVHKGIEKLAEGQSFEKALFLSERISGDETVTNSLAYCMAFEKMAGMGELPARADYLRTVLCELERIYNHLGDIAGICIDTAYGFAAYQFNMMRRWCMMLNEELTGSRYLRSSVKPGGVRKDFIAGREKRVTAELDRLEKEFRETVDIVRSNSMLIDRVENTGVIKPDIAKDLNAVGPAGRSAGIDRDIRRDMPYAAYGRLRFNVPVHNNGDVSCRMNIRIEELIESISMIRQCIDMMPGGKTSSGPIPVAGPYSYAFALTESPRGENFHWLMAGENGNVFRYKIRTPSFYNWPVLCHAVKGNVIPDFPLINKSFNLSYSGNDL
jgi:Ni,Fe-hydrogenase III large subunit/Ni,Fe-hydrogenase III component G